MIARIPAFSSAPQIVRAQEQTFSETIVRREREMSAEFRARVEEKEREFAVVAAQREESKRVRVCLV
jgi:hypothetical protein